MSVLPERERCEAGVAQMVERRQYHTAQAAGSNPVPGLVPENPPGISRSESMRVECSWCGKVLKKGPPPVSHGMCADCAHGWADS